MNNHTSMMLAQNAPFTIVHLLLGNLRDKLGRTESLMGFQKMMNLDRVGTRSIAPDVQTRALLNTISRVHSEFTDAAKHALLARIFILNQMQLQTFLSNSTEHGPYVRELSYNYCNAPVEFGGYDTDDEDLDDDPENSINFAMSDLQEIISKAPNLRALYFAFEFDHKMEDPDLGTAKFLKIVPLGSHLQALHIDGGWTSKNLARLCTIVSESNTLTILSIFGVYSKGGSMKKLPKLMPSKPPPNSFSRFLLAVDDIPAIVLQWFLRPREGYALRELRLHSSIRYARKVKLISSLSETLPLLLDLLLEIHEDDLESKAHEAVAMAVAAKIVSGCTSLQRLWIDRFPRFPLPRTLEELYQTQEPSTNSETGQEASRFDDVEDNKRKTYLQAKLQSGELPNLRGVYMPKRKSLTDKDTCYFPKTKALCEEFAIQFVVGHSNPPWTWNCDD